MKKNYGSKLIFKYVLRVFPEVGKELDSWANICKSMDNGTIRELALSSIRYKKFHAQGGCVYALYPKVDLKKTVKFIVALQTISDYLDNLCDRAGIKKESAFRQLHLSMLDAVDPKRPLSDYYRFYPYKSDNGYLVKLVEECRKQIQGLPSYNLVLDHIKKYIQLYSDLQTYKHLDEKTREDYLETWANYYLRSFPAISCWEFSAASGSTLGIFVLFASAFNPSLSPDMVKKLDAAYFPWICGLHILLDYYIDSVEDMQMGDLNFTYYYDNLKHCESRLSFFIENSLQACHTLEYPEFHTTVVKGLLAMYLSDPKAFLGLNKLATRNILRGSSSKTAFYHNLCKILRFSGII
jgi:tetraprenyl-beta-curcumene synthase